MRFSTRTLPKLPKDKMRSNPRCEASNFYNKEKQCNFLSCKTTSEGNYLCYKHWLEYKKNK